MKKNKYLFPLAVIGLLFFVFGFSTWLNSILIPYFKITLELNNSQSTLVTFAFFISYFIMALPSYWVLEKIGFRNGIFVGLLLMVLGALMFIPAAYIRTYWAFLLGLFILGSGLALLQTAVNPYITILGPLEGAAKRMSFMGIANKVAGIMSQRILGGLFLLGADDLVEKLKTLGAAERALELDAMALRVINPYILMAASMLIIALLVRLAKLPEVQAEEASNGGGEGKKSVWHHPNLVLGVITLFFALGAEVIAGDYIITYGSNIGIPFAKARFFTEYTLYAMLVGYIAGTIFIPKYIKQEKALLYCAILGVLFSIATILTTGMTSVTFVILMGFTNALLWPAIWPLALRGVGRHTKIASAMLIMAISGGALIPIVFGRMLDTPSPANAFIVMIICYAIIALYALVGRKINTWKKSV